MSRGLGDVYKRQVFVPAENRSFQFSHRQGQDGLERTKPRASHYRLPKGERAWKQEALEDLP